MKTLFLTLLVSLPSLASEYEYTLLNFSSSRERTEAEILKESGLERGELDFARCDRAERFQPLFWDFATNLQKDSLKIEADGKKYFYREGRLYLENGDLARRIKGSFLKETMNSLKTMEKFELTRNLLRQMESSHYPVIVLKGGNRYSPHMPGERSGIHMNNATMVYNLADKKPLVDGMIFDRIGYGGHVYWSPALVAKSKFMEADGVERVAPKEVVLAHELMHAYDAIRGLLDRRFVQSKVLEQTTVAEFRAVYLENYMRKNMGGEYRRFYSYSDGAVKDLLDDNDEPILLPTPCIDWL